MKDNTAGAELNIVKILFFKKNSSSCQNKKILVFLAFTFLYWTQLFFKISSNLLLTFFFAR